MNDEIKVGVKVKMKKNHACGANEWKVERYGADIKLRCVNCDRVVMLERPKFLKNVKKILND